MTIGFSTKFPDGTPTLFKEKILLPFEPYYRQLYPSMKPKIHTFRRSNRWKAGIRMHLVTGNRTPLRAQFNTGIAELEFCNGTQQCNITLAKKPMPHILIRVDGRLLQPEEQLQFMYNDGFENMDQMWNWFRPNFESMDECWYGELIHFTKLRY